MDDKKEEDHGFAPSVVTVIVARGHDPSRVWHNLIVHRVRDRIREEEVIRDCADGTWYDDAGGRWRIRGGRCMTVRPPASRPGRKRGVGDDRIRMVIRVPPSVHAAILAEGVSAWVRRVTA